MIDTCESLSLLKTSVILAANRRCLSTSVTVVIHYDILTIIIGPLLIHQSEQIIYGCFEIGEVLIYFQSHTRISGIEGDQHRPVV